MRQKEVRQEGKENETEKKMKKLTSDRIQKLKLVKSLKNMANKMLTNQRQVISTQL